jgi:type III pantothenate kinase
MRQLLINLNNTNTTLAIAEGAEITRQEKVPTQELPSKHALARELSAECSQIVLCSVIPRAAETLERVLPPDRPVIRVRHQLKLPFSLVDYPGAHTLGADRIANTVYAHSLQKFPTAVIDFGTAVTYDVLDDDGFYRGGVIAPGLGAFTTYLHERTAQLPRVEFAHPQRVFGQDTFSAIQSGCFYSVIGAVRETLTQILREGGWMRDALHTIATGGYAHLMARELPELLGTVSPEATLHGMRIIGETNGG